MEKFFDDILVLLVDAGLIFLISIPGIIFYNISNMLDKKRETKRNRVGSLVRKKEGELS